MEALNKKTLLHIFLGFVFIQVFILLAISANFLLAQTDSTTTPDYYTTDTTTDYTTDTTYDYTTDYYPTYDTTYDYTPDSTTYDYTPDDTTNSTTYDYPTTDDSSDNITTPDDNAIDTTDDTTDYYPTTDSSGDSITIPDDSAIDTAATDSSINNITITPLTLTFLERLEPPLSGDQQISVVSNQEIFSCVFKIYGPKYAEFSGIKDSPTNYRIILRTKDFPDGYYTIKAVAGNNIETAEIRLDAEIKNQITTEIEPDQSSETEPVYYPTESVPTETISISYPDQSISDSSIIKIDYPETTYFQPEQIVIKITPECINQGIDNQEECDQLMKNLFRLTFECRNTNITDIEECDKFMMENFLPEECRQQGIINKEECDYLLRNTYRDFEIVVEKTVLTDSDYKSPLIKEIIEIELPEECRTANITTKEGCEKYMFEKFAPDDCREAGILNPEACKKYMFEKYNGAENIPQDKFPIECQKANVQIIEECDQIMKKVYLPQECKEEGIENENECELYLNEKYMSQECREAEAKSRSECDKIMFKKFGPPECREAGIEDEQKCEKYMFDKYAPKVKCNNLEDWQCNDFIKERYLGNIVAKQTVFNKINEKKEEITGKSMKAEDPRMETIQKEKMYPLVEKNIGIKIIATSESMVLDEKDNLVQTASMAFMIDSDEDGLSDDMEKRFGTDPFKTDTDEDGYSDGEEIKNGHNPLGEGKFEAELAPIEKALMENKSLGHPVTEGEEIENFSVENISNTKDAQGNLIEGYILSGKTSPDSVATLYIYSDLPIVVTVNADEYGNWRYQLDQSLLDGEHEVYVAINDDTGKVIGKSKPLNFFVKEASAVSVKDFVSAAKASPKDLKESETSIYYYLLITLFMAIAGIFIFLAVIISRKKNQTLQ